MGHKIFNRVLCYFTGHQMDIWEFEVECLCEQIHKCKRCNYEENRTLHDWGGLKYVKEDSCDQHYLCKRCKGEKKENNKKHEWGAWNYISDNSCKQSRLCKRCKEEEKEYYKKHEWGDWSYLTDGSCEQTRVCKRCKKSEFCVVHSFDQNHCTRCGDTNYPDYSCSDVCECIPSMGCSP